MIENMKKCDRCRNRKVEPGDKKLVRKCSFEMSQFPIEDEDACEHYDSRFIEYPLTISGIDNRFNDEGLRSLYKCGKLVRVSPCEEEYEGKTYLGILLGDLPIGAFIALDRESKKLQVSPHTNPGIFVPELSKIIYGCESWWGEIKSPEELKDITNEEIENTWYVQLLKQMSKQEEIQDNEAKCRICGCTSNHACEGGCYWTEKDLCSKCAEKIQQKEGKKDE